MQLGRAKHHPGDPDNEEQDGGFSLNMIILFKKLLSNDKYVFAKVIPEFQAFCQRIKDMFLRFTFMVTVMLMMKMVMMNGQNHQDIRNDKTHF